MYFHVDRTDLKPRCGDCVTVANLELVDTRQSL